MSCCLPPKLELLMDGIEHAYAIAEPELKDLIREIIIRGSRRGKNRKPIWYKIRGEHKERNSNGEWKCFIINIMLDNIEIPAFYSYDKIFATHAALQLAEWLENEYKNKGTYPDISIVTKTEKELKEEEKLKNLELKNFYFK